MGRVVEIEAEGRSLSKSRGFLVSHCDGEEIGRVPLDDLAALILTARSMSISRALLSELSSRGIAVVFAGQNYEPEGIMVPAKGQPHAIGSPIDQKAATNAFNARLWQKVVQAKIRNQSLVLGQRPSAKSACRRLAAVASRVQPGDPDNREASAARTYFLALFGSDFARNDPTNAVNAHLNYGYSIVRSSCARTIAAVGLSPALGIHHSSRRNPLSFADDIMEIFRPMVDWTVYSYLASNPDPAPELDVTAKHRLAGILEFPTYQGLAQRPLANAIKHVAIDFAKAFQSKKHEISFPIPVFQGSGVG